jgi:ketosteroid isomerase-like protein
MTGAEAIQEIAPLLEAYTAGTLADDAGAVSGLYSTDTDEMGRTHADIVERKERAMEDWTYTAWSFEPIDAWVRGDEAYVISKVDITREAEGGDTVSSELYSFMRLVKVNGEWKIHRNVAGQR